MRQAGGTDFRPKSCRQTEFTTMSGISGSSFVSQAPGARESIEMFVLARDADKSNVRVDLCKDTLCCKCLVARARATRMPSHCVDLVSAARASQVCKG